MSSDPLVLGVDVGGTKVAVGAIRAARVSHLEESPTPLTDSDTLLDGVELTVRRVIAQVGQPAAVGVGVPSRSSTPRGRVESSVNIPLTGVPLREELGRRFGVPVFVDNDANCAALAEAQFVDDAPPSVLVMLTLGTGVGGGVVIGGEIFRGAHGLGAELGHFTIDPDGPPCPGTVPAAAASRPIAAARPSSATPPRSRGTCRGSAPRHRLSPRGRQGVGRERSWRRRTRAMPTPSGCSSASGACSAWLSPGT